MPKTRQTIESRFNAVLIEHCARYLILQTLQGHFIVYQSSLIKIETTSQNKKNKRGVKDKKEFE